MEKAAPVRLCERCKTVPIYAARRRLCPACARANQKERQMQADARRAVLRRLARMPPRKSCPFCGREQVMRDGVMLCRWCFNRDIQTYADKLKNLKQIQGSAALLKKQRFKQRFLSIQEVVRAAEAEKTSYGVYVWRHGLFELP